MIILIFLWYTSTHISLHKQSKLYSHEFVEKENLSLKNILRNFRKFVLHIYFVYAVWLHLIIPPFSLLCSNIGSWYHIVYLYQLYTNQPNLYCKLLLTIFIYLYYVILKPDRETNEIQHLKAYFIIFKILFSSDISVLFESFVQLVIKSN